MSLNITNECNMELELKKLHNENLILKGKLYQAKTFIKGLKETENNVTIGSLRSFIDANYENIIK